MKIENVVVEKEIYIAEDGTQFENEHDCRMYEKYEMPVQIKPEWIERHQKQVAENEKIKEIVLKSMIQGKNYNLTDLYFEILPQLDFCRKRVTIQRLCALVRQLVCNGFMARQEFHRYIYFIKL